MAMRQCPYCGKIVADDRTQCPHCREALEAVPEVRPDSRTRGKGGSKIRQGLLYMLLAGIIYYFAGGYSAMKIPLRVQPVVTVYLAPLLFLSGLGLSLYGLYLRRRA